MGIAIFKMDIMLSPSTLSHPINKHIAPKKPRAAGSFNLESGQQINVLIEKKNKKFNLLFFYTVHCYHHRLLTYQIPCPVTQFND